jgi:DNA repair exonuclease SbcCD nuclease subunit
MKLQLLSDLHREFDRATRVADAPRFEAIPDTAADVILLAGDIDIGLTGLRWAIGEAERLRRPILYVFGNHEYYGQAMPSLLQKGRALMAGTGVHLLERDVVILNGVRFLGCTLWTDFALFGDAPRAMRAASAAMTDFRRVRVSPAYRRLQPRDLLAEHHASIAWLRARLTEPSAPPTVILTHHAPSARSVPEAYRDDALSPAYASDLEALMGPPVIAWVHGHVHTPMDNWVKGTRVLCNPRGYYPDDLAVGFDASRILEIDCQAEDEAVGAKPAEASRPASS